MNRASGPGFLCLFIVASNMLAQMPGPAALRVLEAWNKLPLSFEANQGQAADQVKFLSRGGGYSLFLTPKEIVLSLRTSAGRRCAIRKPRSSVLRMEMAGANPAPAIEALDRLPGVSNYLLGSDPQRWRTGVAHYARVRYREVYPGVDLIFYGNPDAADELEYDLVVRPGADPASLVLRFHGAKKLGVNTRGDLVLETGAGQVVQRKPVVYQELNSVRVPVRGRYFLRGRREVGFAVADYDRRRPLVLDPVLIYSTFLGGNGIDFGIKVTVDSAGNAYILGETRSLDFPRAGPAQSALGGGTCPLPGLPNEPCRDIFVTKLRAGGNALGYSTYLGGSNDETAGGIAVDSAGNAYVTGATRSTDFPTKNPLQASSQGNFDAFVAKLNATGSVLLYSTYLGGNGTDAGSAIAVDANGNAYVTGRTFGNFPTANALQSRYGGGGDAFVSKLNPAGDALIYSTYLGGGSGDSATDLALDPAGNVYLTGSTQSSDFPTVNPLQAKFSGGTCGATNTFTCRDAFVAKLNAAGKALIYSTYLGGAGDDIGNGVAIDAAGNAYVVGETSSQNFPTMQPLQAAFRGGPRDAFVSKLNPQGSALLYSTYLGGSADEQGAAIAADAAGNAYITGFTTSTDFPTLNQLQGPGGAEDSFVAKLNPAGSAVYSTYLGGVSHEFGFGIALDVAGRAYLTGRTSSDNFPAVRPFQRTKRAGVDAYVAKLAETPVLPDGGTVNGASFATGAAVAPGSIASVFGSGLTSSVESATATPLPSQLAGASLSLGGVAVPLIAAFSGQINIQIPWEVAGQAQAGLTASVDGMTSNAQTVSLAAFAPGIFTLGAQQGAVIISSGEVAAPNGSIPGRSARPAARGEVVVVYCTGLGEVTNRPATGAAASDNPLSLTNTQPAVTIGGVSADIQFSGLAPGFVGLNQVNVQVPANAPTGPAVPLVLTIGGATSNTVTIAVQ